MFHTVPLLPHCCSVVVLLGISLASHKFSSLKIHVFLLQPTFTHLSLRDTFCRPKRYLALLCPTEMPPELEQAIPSLRFSHKPTRREIEFSDSNEKVEGPVVSWCLSLRNTTIHQLEIHRTLGRYSVIFTLGDDTVFSFERIVSANPPVQALTPPSSTNTHRDWITPVLEEPDLRSRPVIKIEFPYGVPEGLKFVLAACHRIQKTEWQPSAPESSMFAWMLATLVARKQLPPISDIVANPKTPIEGLWSAVHSYLQPTGKSLWENNFIAETQKMVENRIFQALHDEIGARINNNDVLEQVVVCSVIAWVKFLASISERSALLIWDNAWDSAWSKEWAQAWEQEWGGQWESLWSGVGRISMPKGVGSRASGRAAGRATIDLKHVEMSITRKKTPPNIDNNILSPTLRESFL